MSADVQPHNRTAPSSPAEASSVPSGLNATARTQSRWPVSVGTGAPVAASHNRTVLSCPAEASSVPSGLNATAAQRQLVSDASHELRTPLTSLRINVELLASEP